MKNNIYKITFHSRTKKITPSISDTWHDYLVCSIKTAEDHAKMIAREDEYISITYEIEVIGQACYIEGL